MCQNPAVCSWESLPSRREARLTCRTLTPGPVCLSALASFCGRGHWTLIPQLGMGSQSPGCLSHHSAPLAHSAGPGRQTRATQNHVCGISVLPCPMHPPGDLESLSSGTSLYASLCPRQFPPWNRTLHLLPNESQMSHRQVKQSLSLHVLCPRGKLVCEPHGGSSPVRGSSGTMCRRTGSQSEP